MAAHDFDDEAPAVGGSGGFDHIHQVDDGVEGGVHADTHVGSVDVVINGAGQANDGVAKLVEFQRAGEGAVTADDHECVNFFLAQDTHGFALAFFFVKAHAACAGEESAGLTGFSADFEGAKADELAVKDALVAVFDTYDFQAAGESSAGDGTDGRVHAGGVAAGGEDADAFEHTEFVYAGPGTAAIVILLRKLKIHSNHHLCLFIAAAVVTKNKA